MGLFVGTFANAQTYIMDITGASPMPSTIAVGQTSTIEINYQVPDNSDIIPINTAKIIIQFPAAFYTHNNVLPSGGNADYFNWSVEAGKIIGVNNTELSNSLLVPTSGGLIQAQCIGVAESVTPQTFNVNVDEVFFLAPVSGSPSSGNILVSGTLPIKLSAFNAQLNNCETVDVSWKTSEEFNSDKFVVERKFGTKGDFVAIGEVQAAGISTTEMRYAYMDQMNDNFVFGAVYYRLMQVDNDGKTEYSNVISVNNNCGITPEASVFPNPVVKELNVKLPSLWEGDAVTIEFYNEQGKLVRTEQVQKVTDLELQFNIGDLPTGIYNLKLTNNNSTLNKRFVRLD